ncbi:MAG: phosphatase PAP2 family protein [Comamonadaceae bacterium]|nr:MAG: phosphatase PAP2 family protein [Comamonadaceae bacterium]
MLAFAAIVAWDFGGLDLPLARLMGGGAGFPMRGSRALVLSLHEMPRFLSWAMLIGLGLAVVRPFGLLRRLSRFERAQLALSVLASVLVVAGFKYTSRTSCPWDLQAFGGIARHVSHWALGVADGGPGGCFPAGHASAAFAYLGGWFVFRRASPRLAWAWFAAAVGAGLLLGLAQQWRGAHFMSHTLWTAWLCWTTGLLIDLAAQRWPGKVPPAGTQ